MTTVYLKNGTTYRDMNKESLNIYDELPIGTYTVKFNQLENYYYVASVDDFNIGSKIYGNTAARANRILDTFNDRPASTGVLLAGDKGSGKTQLAKLISTLGSEQGIITILVNEPHSGESFNQFIQNITQPSIIIFDEFEKVYNDDRGLQDQILTILDGVYPSKKLFIATINNKHRISDFMLNRPGRFFYKYEYGRLEEDVIIEYCNDNLINKDYLSKIVTFSSLTSVFSFDILKAIVEEVNRYGGEFQETVDPLNISVEAWARVYKITNFVVKKDAKFNKPHNGKFPEFLSGQRAVSINEQQFVGWYSDDEEDEFEVTYLPFSLATNYNGRTGEVTYETENFIITASPHKEDRQYSVFDAL